ncbi:MAG: hypothetical protein E6J20_18485 [Chloroflexi bacterium]|nr:MAG: hypothetical protein E6J20_18485 [Chloroflexota bacterium]
MSGDVVAPTASSLRMRAVDWASSAASAAPRVADPPETITAQFGRVLSQPHGPYGDVVAPAVVRQECGEWYVWCDCGFTTGYCESQVQASRIAAHHSREAHDL